MGGELAAVETAAAIVVVGASTSGGPYLITNCTASRRSTPVDAVILRALPMVNLTGAMLGSTTNVRWVLADKGNYSMGFDLLVIVIADIRNFAQHRQLHKRYGAAVWCG